jgi:hypothetical protein
VILKNIARFVHFGILNMFFPPLDTSEPIACLWATELVGLSVDQARERTTAQS